MAATKPGFRPRDPNLYTNEAYGRGASAAPMDDLCFNPKIGRITVLRPKGKDGPLWFRPSPAIDYLDNTILKPGRNSNEAGGQSHWYCRVDVASYIGAKGCPSKTFILKYPFDEETRDTPYQRLFFTAVAKAKAARLQREIANIRKDFVHQVSHHIATTAQVVVLETLNVKGMFANHALARALSNASMSELHRQIDYKVQQRGGTVILVDPWEPTSKRCSNRGCGAVLDTLPLSVRSWICPSCGTPHDRDVNAARNILAVGLGKPEFTRGDWRVQERVTPFRCARLNRESTQSPASGWTACG